MSNSSTQQPARLPPRNMTAVRQIAEQAGAEILNVYNQSAELVVDYKSDDSPLCEADRRAHQLICRELARLTPELPVLSEESDAVSFATRSGWPRYWLVDPLDGTKEFIGRNGEFTVNIALIESGTPVAGVVHVPVTGVTYCGDGEVAVRYGAADDAQGVKLAGASMQGNPNPRVVASRNHRGEQVDGLIELLEQTLGKTDVVSMGSSLKMCLLAEGKADLYPRLAPTCEWDTAAAHAVLRTAGGEIVDLQWRPLRYNQKDSLLNPFFIAMADRGYGWRELIGESLVED